MKIKYPSLSIEKRRSSLDSEETGSKVGPRVGSKCLLTNCIIIALPIVAFLSLGIYFILVDLKILSSVLKPSNETLLQEVESLTNSTTQKPFLYSPTVPHVTGKDPKLEDTTKNQGPSEECFSTRLQFCEGVLPYDLVSLPLAVNVTGLDELDSLLPRFLKMIESNCSARARDVVCSILEPECRPIRSGHTLPCRSNCRAVAEDCARVIAKDPILSDVFNCRDDVDWDGSAECVNLFRGYCHADEFDCADGRCVPLRWVCDGSVDCPQTGSDEDNCRTCGGGSFRCTADDRCIPAESVCDGEPHCSDGSDEIC